MPFDELTKLYDRRDLFTRLKQEIARSTRTHVPFSIVMIDIDHFKEVNDNYGHLRGDCILAEVAQIISKNCREMDIPCRYGGDEFVIIMPETDRYAVEKAAGRILEKLRGHTFPGYEQYPDLYLTVSIGTATYSAELKTPESLLKKADDALYLAKKEGRNRIFKDIDVTEKMPAPSLNFKAFIDRIEEIDILKTKFNSVLEKNGSFVVVNGEAGIGKTRLIMELKKYSSLHKAVFLSSKPFEFGITPPYHIFFQIIKEYFQQLGRHNIQIFGILQSVYKTELVKFIPELISVINTFEESSKLSPEYEKMRLFDAIYHVLAIIAQKSSLIIFLDDMQWARESDLELLGYLVRNIVNLPILVCCAYRIEEVDEQHPLSQFLRAMSREHRFEMSGLKGLCYNDTKQLLNAIIGFFVPENICNLIYNETKGNPFYIEEIIKSFVEQGNIYWVKTNWAFKDLKNIMLPRSIGDLMHRRLENVESELKELLNQASAIGNQFTIPLLQKLTNKNEGYLLDLLDLGIKNLLINVESNEKYSFANILLQRALYEDLTPTKRRRLHLQIAQALEILYAGELHEVYENLSHHYLMAEEWQLAFDYNLKAAKKLKELYANQDAILHYMTCLDLINQNKVQQTKLAIQIYQALGEICFLISNYMDAMKYYKILLQRDDLDVKRKSETMVNLGRIYEKVADFDSALECYDEARKFLDDKEHKIEMAKLDAAAIPIYIKRGEHTKVISLAANALSVFESMQDDNNLVSVYTSLGTMYYDKSEWDKAETFYKKALDHMEKTNDLYQVANCLNNLGNVYHRISNYDNAIEYHTKALKIREKIGDRYGISSSLNNIALIYDESGEWKRCIEYHHKSLDISKSLNSVRSVALSYCNLGFTLLKMGELEKSVEYSLQALKIFKAIGDLNLTASTQNNLAYAYIALGKTDEALKELKEAAEISSMYDFKFLLTESHRFFAELNLKSGNLDNALKFARRALDIAQKISDKVDEAEAHITLGNIYIAQNRLDEAGGSFKKCKEIATFIKDDYILAKSYYYCGILMKKNCDYKVANELLKQAKSIFERLGAERFLELVNLEMIF